MRSKQWYDYDDPKDKEYHFVWDTKEMLTGHFGNIGTVKEKKLMKSLKSSYKTTMKNIYDHGIVPNYDYICKLFGVKKDSYWNDYNDEDVAIIGGIVEMVFNGE